MATYERLKLIVCQMKGVKIVSSQVTGSATLSGDLGLESLDVVAFFQETEGAFEVDIPIGEQQLLARSNIGDIADYLDGERSVIERLKRDHTCPA